MLSDKADIEGRLVDLEDPKPDRKDAGQVTPVLRLVNLRP